MKIAILTQPLRANYGGILQNYALQQVLINLGHEPITIEKDLHQYISLSKLIIELPKRIFTKYFLRKRKYIFSEKAYNRWLDSLYFDQIVQFVKSRITHRYVSNFYVLNLTEFDAFLVGSDQIWRPIYNHGYIDKMFLSFIPKDNPIKRIAYAASFGAAEWEFSNEQTATCKELAHRFDAISVREDNGVVLCKNYLNVDATHVLDPTLLLDKEHYCKLCANIPNERGYLCAYILDPTDDDKIRLEEIATSKGLKLKLCSAEIYCTQSIEEWIAMFRDAEIVITNSFHGTIFSIIFNKEFYCRMHIDRGSGRIPSLFRQLNITQERIVTTLSEVMNNTCILHWDTINNRIRELQQQSITFIEIHLLKNKS